MSYYEKRAKDAAIRAKILYEGRADASPHPTVFVEAARRRDVEAFAARLRGMEPVEQADFARTDASAMLVNLSGGDPQILAELQTAILNSDMADFVDKLDRHRIGNLPDRNNLRAFVAKQDREAIAACLRMIVRSVQADREDTREVGLGGPGQVDVGLEVANRAYPLMGNNRRIVDSTFLIGNNWNDPTPLQPFHRGRFRRPPQSTTQPMSVAALQLGEDALDTWEENMQFHAYLHDGMNAAADVAMEAAGAFTYDGRVAGVENAWANQG